LCWLTDAQMERLKPCFPVSHGGPRVDDKRVLSGIIFFNRNGLRWRDAPAVYGPHKTLCNRWFRWSQKGEFARILLERVRQEAETEMIRSDVEPEVRHGPTPLARADWFRNALIDRGITPCIPSRKNRKVRVENTFGRLRDWRRIAMRFDRRADIFLSACALAAIVMFLP
jgi:transposase